MLFCFCFSSAQEKIICDSEFNFFGVDMDENNGNGSTNSTYDWFVFEEEFQGEIIPQTPSGNQIIIEWQDTPEGEYTVLVQEINTDVACEAEPQQMLVFLKEVIPENILGPTYVCEGESIFLEHSFKTDGTWALEDNSIGQVSQNGKFDALQSGNVIVNFTYKNKDCEFSVSKFIQVQPKPKPILLDSQICLDLDSKETVLIDSGLPEEEFEFLWYYNEQIMEGSDSSILVSDIGEYKLQVINSETGCMSEAVSTQVVQLADPKVSVSVHTDFNNTQKIIVHIANPGQYLFKLEDGVYQDSSVFTNITREGKYQLYIQEKLGCYEKEIEAIVINYPRFFTPNGDGFNDTWNILSLEEDETAEIFIYDRYGKFLKTITPTSEGWDGMYQGKKMPSDDYWFLVEYTGFNDGIPREFKANFTLKN